MKPLLQAIAAVVCALGPLRAPAQAAGLEVVQAAPQGEIDALAEAAEVRVVFSEPMVVLGRVPSVVSAPFFRITPARPGSLRWSGTRTLLFTPADPAHVPYATRYQVTIDASATSASGTPLGRPYTFSFTTPTVRLLQATWSRREHRFDRPVVLLLRFNQPVSHASVDPHLAVAFQSHDFKPPAPPGDDHTPATPAARQAFDAKVALARESAGLGTAVTVKPTDDWDKKAYPAADDLLAFETTASPPPEAWLRVTLDASVHGRQGEATPGKTQDRTVQIEPAFFVDGFRCRRACDPDDENGLALRGRVMVPSLRKRLRAADITEPAHPAALVHGSPHAAAVEEEEPEPDGEGAYDRASSVTA